MKELKQKYRTVWRFYTIADYEREERWLNEMAAAGWEFVRTNGFRFRFRKGEPGSYRYKIDLVERNEDDAVREEYFNFLTECGNRVVCEYKDWIYLQRPAADGPFEGTDDAYARLRVMNKAYDFAIRTVCRLLRIFMLLFALTALLGANLWPNIPFFRDFGTGIAIGALLAMTLIWVPIISKLRRRVNRLIGEVGIKR